jgi:hypothetical protein
MDLEKAFLQISVREADRDALRFFWPTDPFTTGSTINTYRFTRVAFGVISSPYLLGATTEHHLSQTSDALAQQLINGSYVDNYIVPIHNPDDIHGVAAKARNLFWSGGFNCRQFNSDCRKQVARLPEEWKEPEAQVKLLGIPWDTENDLWNFKFPPTDGVSTKRTLLSTIASMFDPNGWCSPTLLAVKQLQARAWTAKYDWDDPLSDSLIEEWGRLTNEWKDTRIVLPRRCFPLEPDESIQLHAFADASLTGLGFVIYAKSLTQQTTGILFARSLVIPTSFQPKVSKRHPTERPISIPRLELQAMHLAARAASQIANALHPQRTDIVLWTDVVDNH